MQTFWLAKNGVQQGPMPLAQAQKLIDDGHYQPHHMAWVVGTQAWCTIAEMPELSAGFRPPGTPLGADHPDATATPPPPPPAARVPLEGALRPHSQMPRPWRRYAARMLDLACIDYVLTLFAGPHMPFGGLGASVVLGPAVALLLIPVEALCIQHVQTTLGKYCFGIVVRASSGPALTQTQSFERAVKAACFGNALGLPGVGWLTNFIAYLDIRRPESATWDRTTRSVVLYEDGTLIRQMLGSMLLAYFELSSMINYVTGGLF